MLTLEMIKSIVAAEIELYECQTSEYRYTEGSKEELEKDVKDAWDNVRFYVEDAKYNAAPDMYDALWETIELSDRNLTEAGRTPECQRVYDIVRAALAKAEGE